jgi:hypothetical protein
MAEYNPTTFAEFLACLDTDTTKTVNLPVNAEWDASELEPEGHTGSILLYGTINGNGTKIKNLVVRNASNGAFTVNGTVTDLHFTDGVWEAGMVVHFPAQNGLVQLCTFSASLQGSGTATLFNFEYPLSSYRAYVYRCAANIEVATSTTVTVFANKVEAKYCNMKISGSLIEHLYLFGGNTERGKVDYSYFLCDTPAVTDLEGVALYWSFIRCTGANVTDLRYICKSSSKITLCCDSDFPNASQLSNGVRLCTESQLHDAAYLQSIGFPIGVEY